MRVDRSQSGEYAYPKRIRITHDVHVALSIFNDFGEHASRIMRMWSRGIKLLKQDLSELCLTIS